MTQNTYHRKFTDSDVTTIVSALQSLPAPPGQSRTGISAGFHIDNPALKVINCVLSLNRHYDEFVVPTLRAFKKRNPAVISLADLDNIMKSKGGAYAFFRSELGYNDSARAQVFDSVLMYLIRVQEHFPASSEPESLHNWAIAVRPADYQQVPYLQGIGTRRIKGFAISGWQYLRMLFGADTCKPDRHILAFLRDTIKRNVNPLHAVEVMEITAPMAGLTVREADHRIWSKYSGDARARRARPRRPRPCAPGHRAGPSTKLSGGQQKPSP